MNKCLTILLLCLAIGITVNGQKPFATWTATELNLSNGIVQRTIQLPSSTGNYSTTSYKPMSGEFRYFTPTNVEFQFEVNDVVYSGKGKWTLVIIKRSSDNKEGDGADVTLLSGDKKVELTIQYLLYPKLPVIRKRLIIKNLTNEIIRLESVDVERFTTVAYLASTFSWIYSDYGRRKSIGPYEGNMQDALMIIHNPDWKQGIVIGNEASGVLKRTSAFWKSTEITSGLTHKAARFPFRKWIKPGYVFETPQVFTMVYNNQKNPTVILNTLGFFWLLYTMVNTWGVSNTS